MNYFIVTVDTETYKHNDSMIPLETNIYGYHEEKAYGIDKIMDTCDQYGFPATFFVDVYMHHFFGIDAIKKLCQHINNRGHNVELHAHPNNIPGKKFGLMSAYSLEDQVKIIDEGKTLLEQWINKPIVAFRAGCYGANLDTIKALEKNKISIDSSYFVYNRQCRMSAELGNRYINNIFKVKNITEIPVTVYQMISWPNYLKRFSKIDFNACSKWELDNAIRKFIKKNDNVIILFLHSFSFIKWKDHPSNLTVNKSVINTFDNILHYIAQDHNSKLLSINNLHKLLNDEFIEKSSLEETIPESNMALNVLRFIRRLAS